MYSMRGFPLVHSYGAAMIDHALGVAHHGVFVPHAHGLQQFQTGDSRRPGAVQHDAHVLDLLARQVQRVDQASRADDRGAMLIVMKDGNIHFLFQALLDDETLRCLDILQVDTAEGRSHQPHGGAEFIRILGIQLDIDGVHIGKALEQHRLALHHRLGSQCAQIAQPQNRGTVGNDCNQIALVGVVIGHFGMVLNGQTRDGDTGRIGQAQIALRRHRDGRGDLEFPRCRLKVEGQRLFGGEFGVWHEDVLKLRLRPHIHG